MIVVILEKKHDANYIYQPFHSDSKGQVLQLGL